MWCAIILLCFTELYMFLLASESPQRKRILASLGVECAVIPHGFDESSIHEKNPEKRARILAEAKARAVSSNHPDQWVIGMDTLVVSRGGELLEKPLCADDARRMLRLHSGNTSTVHSAICMMHTARAASKPPIRHTGMSSTYVTFKNLAEEDIEWWIATDLWNDRSGGFQIEGEGQKLITHVDGEYETVVGFPVHIFRDMCLLHGLCAGFKECTK
jgi:septum formation protein